MAFGRVDDSGLWPEFGLGTGDWTPWPVINKFLRGTVACKNRPEKKGVMLMCEKDAPVPDVGRNRGWAMSI